MSGSGLRPAQIPLLTRDVDPSRWLAADRSIIALGVQRTAQSRDDDVEERTSEREERESDQGSL